LVYFAFYIEILNKLASDNTIIFIVINFTPKFKLMKPLFYFLTVRVYTSEMMEFYKDDPKIGSKEKPYQAEVFSEIISPYAKFYGPQKNILIFESNCVYQWELESSDGRPLTFSKSDDAPELDMVMITDSPSNQKWRKILKDAPEMQFDGKIRVKSKSPDKNVFQLQTTDNLTDGGKVKYSLFFEFEHNGVIKYAVIDPFVDTWPPPPPPVG